MKRSHLHLRGLVLALATVVHALVGCGGADSNPIDDTMGNTDPPTLVLVFQESVLPPPNQIVTTVKDAEGTDAIEALRRVWNDVASMEVSIYLREDEPLLGTDQPTILQPPYLNPEVSNFVVQILPCNLHSGPTWVSVTFFEEGGPRVETAGPASPTSDCD